MGSTFDSEVYKGPLEGINEFYREVQDRRREEYGNAPYSGHLGIKEDGLIHLGVLHDTYEEALESLRASDHSKWDEALVASYRDGENISYIIGGSCSS